MNDEELRAFLDSATVENDDVAKGRDSEEPESDAANQGNAEGEAAPKRAVPSFDELMNMPSPDEVSAPAQGAPQSTTETSQATPPASAAGATELPQPAVSKRSDEWAPAYAQDNEQLVPLILPGFSSEPFPRRDLPPVFQAEPTVPQEPTTPHDDPAPTQPFDVLNGSEVAREPGATPTAPAVVAASAAAASSTAAATAAAVKSPTLPAVELNEDPLAMLHPDLAESESDDDEYERISVVGSEPRGRKALPWLIVGGGVVIAIIASIFVINGVRGTETPAPTEKPAATSEPAPTESTPETTAPEPSEAPAPEPSVAPVVDPGSTWSLPIDQWGITVEVSEKLGGSTPYTLFDGNTRAMFDSLPVAAGLSDACAVARGEHAWGLRKKDDGTLEAIRPEPRCSSASDAAVYDTIWGVLDYMAKSAKPA